MSRDFRKDAAKERQRAISLAKDEMASSGLTRTGSLSNVRKGRQDFAQRREASKNALLPKLMQLPVTLDVEVRARCASAHRTRGWPAPFACDTLIGTVTSIAPPSLHDDPRRR